MTKFVMLRNIIALKDISAQQKLVLIAMNQYGDEGHNIYPALEGSQDSLRAIGTVLEAVGSEASHRQKDRPWHRCWRRIDGLSKSKNWSNVSKP